MLATAVAFGLLSKVAEFFSESYGASFVFLRGPFARGECRLRRLGRARRSGRSGRDALGCGGDLAVRGGAVQPRARLGGSHPGGDVAPTDGTDRPAAAARGALRRRAGEPGERHSGFSVARLARTAGVVGRRAGQQPARLVGGRQHGLPRPRAAAAAGVLPGEPARRLRPAHLHRVAQQHPPDRPCRTGVGDRGGRSLGLTASMGIPGVDGGRPARTGGDRWSARWSGAGRYG